MSTELSVKRRRDEGELRNCLRNYTSKTDRQITEMEGQLMVNRINYKKVCNENYGLKLKIRTFEEKEGHYLNQIRKLSEDLKKEMLDKQNLKSTIMTEMTKIIALTESATKQEFIIDVLNTEKCHLNNTIIENKTEMEIISKEMAEKKNKKIDIALEVKEYKAKYEECNSYNQKLTQSNDKLSFDFAQLKTKLDKCQQSLKTAQNDSDRKAKAIAAYMNSDQIKNNLLKDYSSLESEVKQLKTDLNDKNILSEKLESELNGVKNQKEELCRQNIEEENKLRSVCQKLVKERDTLLKRNSQLLATKKTGALNQKHQIARFKFIFRRKECQRVKESKSNKKREIQLISTIKSLRNSLNHIKGGCFSYMYKVKQLKIDLNDKNILCEKLESELNGVKNQKEELCQKNIDEKNELRFECQKFVDTYKKENDRLLQRNSQLLDGIEAAKVAAIGIRKHEIARLKLIILREERQRVKESKRKKRETN